jgi:peptide/nickel transport system permease protein
MNSVKPKKQSQFKEVMKRLLSNKSAVFGLIVICIFFILSFLAPIIAPYDYTASVGKQFELPSAEHWCGTDKLGRDILSRLLYGARYSLGLGLASQLFCMVCGTILGSIAGFFGGKVDDIIMRIVDIIQAIPGLLLAIVVSSVLGGGFFNTLIAIGIAKIPGDCRVIRASVMTVREQEFLEAAQSINCSKVRQIVKHVLPNAIAPLIVNATMGIGGTIMFCASLSFIGLGIQPPTPEWGAMLVDGKAYFQYYPHLILFPGICIALTILSLNLLGDGLRDAMDPKLKK